MKIIKLLYFSDKSYKCKNSINNADVKAEDPK